MPCEVGQNIYKLRKKNKQLLDQLESNSVLLENKIKLLRHATRVPRNFSCSKDDQSSSPLKRKHESWNYRNNSCRVATAMIKPGSLEPNVPDAVLCDNKNRPEKSSARNSKKTAAKRVRQTKITKPWVTNSFERQAKGRRNKMMKNTQKSLKDQCYCSQILENHAHEANKSQENAESYPSLRNENTKSTKYLKNPINPQLNKDEELLLSSQSENQDKEYVSSAGSKSLSEARQLLNYSPESMFLRRMKLRLQKSASEPINRDDTKVNKYCNCENICFAASESDHSCPEKETLGPCKSLAMEHNQIGDGDNFEEQCNDNIHSKRGFKNRKDDHITNKIKSKGAKTGKTSVDAFTQVVSQKSATSVRTNSGYKSHRAIQTEECKFTKNKKKITSEKCPPCMTGGKKCLCMKEIGGLCCCEVALTSNKGCCHLSHNTELLAVLKSSASAPEALHLKSCKPSNIKHISSEISGRKLEPREFRRPSGIQSTGYDVIADLLANDSEKFAADPCAKNVEELSHFRQKHWFDCHAHPHGVGSSDQFSDAKECCHQISSLDDELMQPTLDPCIRSFQLNQRLFPKAVAEVHNIRCCAAAQGGCITSPLLPTQRRLVTLPPVPQQNINEPRATVRPTPGVLSYPQSNILICDPTSSGYSRRGPSATSATSPIVRCPVPRNSLALRFQKGVSQSVKTKT